jgi:hypothetical protein
MASIDFYILNTGYDFNIDLAGSGLGFYGSGGFGTSVAVNEWQDTTYVTDGNGLVQGPQGNNVKWTHANSGEVEGTTNLLLSWIPNYQSSLNVRFTHGTAVKVQNVEARIYDRNNINVGASGVTTRVAEIIHPSVTQEAGGSGDSSWIEPAGSGTVVPLAQSPGESGMYAGDGDDSTREDDRHDWYLAITASPDSIGSKTQYGLYVSLEYL